MSAAAERLRSISLPSPPPDTVGFALRSTLAIVGALYVAFWLELDSASSAAVTAGILSQPSRGMILSKAANRFAGTLVGAVVAVVLVANFGQDRTMLLASFALWIGLCVAVATLLRDFRAYGAVLAGYTVGIVALADINAPQDVFTTAISRVAVVATGIVSVAVVNDLLAPRGVWDELVGQMRESLATVKRLALDALDGTGDAADAEASVALGGRLTELHTPIDYAASELQDGRCRANGARSAVAALLTTISCSRTVIANEGARRTPGGQEMLAAARRGLDGGDLDAARASLADLAARAPLSPEQAFLLDRLQEMLAQWALAQDGLRVLRRGGTAARRVRLPPHLDFFAAGLNAVRTVVAVSLASLFVVLAGWPGASFVLIQISALCALISLQQNPTRGSVNMLLGFLPVVPVAAVCLLWILPGISGFPVLAIVMGVPIFLMAMLVKFPRTNPYGVNFLTFFTVLLAPSNPQTYDPSSFANSALQLVLSGVAVVAGFRLILPVSPPRRLFRIADAVGHDLTRALRGEARDQPSRVALRYDRLRQARSWIGRPTLARRKLLAQLLGLSELTGALARAHGALDELASSSDFAAVSVQARRALGAPGHVAGLRDAAQALLGPVPRGIASVRAASALAQAASLIERERRLLRRSGLLEIR